MRDWGEEREKKRIRGKGRRDEMKTERRKREVLCLLCPCRSAEVCVGGKSFTLQPNMVTIKRYQKTIYGK